MTGQPLYILAPFVPTPEEVVDHMLRLADVTSEDVVYDLGCGDGRVVIAAARKFGARGVGVDIEPYNISESQANARQAEVEDLTTFRVEDALAVDFSPATVITLYLVGWSTMKFKPLLARDARPGTRIVSHNYSLEGWEPMEVKTVVDADGKTHTLYLWVMGEYGEPRSRPVREAQD